MKSQLLFAKKQRLKALKLAFKIIDEFANPSCTPDIMSKYDEFKDYLIKKYSK